MHVSSHKPPEWFEIAEKWGAFADFLEVINLKRNSGFTRNSQQMENGICGSTTGGDRSDGVLDCIASENIFCLCASFQQVHCQFTATESNFVFLRIDRRDAVEAHG